MWSSAKEKVQNVIELRVADVYLKILIANRRCIRCQHSIPCNVCNIYFQSATRRCKMCECQMSSLRCVSVYDLENSFSISAIEFID